MTLPRALSAALLAFLLLGLPAARGENASAPLLPGDRLHGNILAAGESDLLTLYLPSGTLFSVDLLPEEGSGILPVLAATDPADEAMDLSPWTTPGPGGTGVRVRDASGGPLGGTFSFLAGAGSLTSGRYTFRLTARMPKKTFGTLTVPAGERGEFTFDAPAGSKMAWSVKPPKGVSADPYTASLRTPGMEEGPLPSLSGKKVPLDQDGTWALLVDNGGATGETLDVTITLTLPKSSNRTLWLSPSGFGPAPRVKSVSPSKVLDDRVAEGVAVAGEGFDPGAAVRLERKGQDPVPASSLVIADAGHLTADFDVTGAATGGWKVVVENPSGGRGSVSFTVKSAGSVKLPQGLRPETEAWQLAFRQTEFREDLAAMGLGSANPDTAALSEAAVRSYTLYWLRLAFGLEPETGKVLEGSVPISFSLDAPPATTGAAGTTWNRLEIGGAAEEGDPSSNPFYPWGDGPLDPGNGAYDDLHRDAGTGRGVRTAALAPTLAGSTAGYFLALKPLFDLPLTSNDQKYYFTNFSPASAAEGTRYRDIVLATSLAGREIAGTIAHFVARAMGTADGASGLSKVPVTVGEYAVLEPWGFTGPERDALAAAVRDGLPGKGSTLRAGYFPLRDTRGYRMPDATTTKAYSESFMVTGGRPDRLPGDTQYTPLSGSIPAGFNFLATGGLSGTAPLRYGDTSLVGGIYRFLYRVRDTVNDDVLFVSHRLNLLVDTANPALSPAEIQYGTQLNLQIQNTPD